MSRAVFARDALQFGVEVFSEVSFVEGLEQDCPEAAEVVVAQIISRLSNGAFDITVAPLVNLWGFGLKHGNAADVSQTMIDSVKAYVGYQKVTLVDHSLLKDDPRITLDASAIAKGYGTDVVADVLREAGCENYLVEIGGEVVLKGVNDMGKPWRVGISRPKTDADGMDEGLQHIIQSSDLCLATSGNYLQYYYQFVHTSLFHRLSNTLSYLYHFHTIRARQKKPLSPL